MTTSPSEIDTENKFVRDTFITIVCLGEDHWRAHITDMGPIDNSHGDYSSDELLKYLRYHVLEREGQVRILRTQSDLIDAKRAAFEAIRDGRAT